MESSRMMERRFQVRLAWMMAEAKMLPEQWRDLLQELEEFVQHFAAKLDPQSAGASAEVSQGVAFLPGAKECPGDCLPVGPGSAAIAEISWAERVAVGADPGGVGWAGGPGVGQSEGSFGRGLFRDTRNIVAE